MNTTRFENLKLGMKGKAVHRASGQCCSWAVVKDVVFGTAIRVRFQDASKDGRGIINFAFFTQDFQITEGK